LAVFRYLCSELTFSFWRKQEEKLKFFFWPTSFLSKFCTGIKNQNFVANYLGFGIILNVKEYQE